MSQGLETRMTYWRPVLAPMGLCQGYVSTIIEAFLLNYFFIEILMPRAPFSPKVVEGGDTLR